MAEEAKSSGAATQITLRVTSRSGPFAHGTITLPVAVAPVLNPNTEPVTVNGARISPLVDERSGLAVAGVALTATVATGPLAAGDAVLVKIGGAVPARPGTYTAQLVLQGDVGPVVTTPVRVEVAASAVWGVSCMLLGLLLLGLLRLLTGEGDVQERAREVQRNRAEIHADWQREPPPESRAETRAEIDRDLDEAARTLAVPRQFSVVDRRLDDAAAALAAARDAAAKLREAMDKAPQVNGDVADLDRDWTNLRKRVDIFDGPTAEAAPQAAEGLAKHVGLLLVQARMQLLVLPARIAEQNLSAQLERVTLTQAAGDMSRARDMAHATRLWMRRAADELEKRMTLVMGLALEADRVVVEDADMRRLAATETLLPEQRSALFTRLDAIDAALASANTLQALADASRGVAEAATQALQDQAAALERRVQLTADAAGDEMLLNPVNAVFAQLRNVEKPSGAEKALGVASALTVWRGMLGVVHDEATRATMRATLDAGIADGNRGDLDGAAKALHAIEHAWQDYLPTHIARAVAVVVAPVCSSWHAAATRSLALTQGEVALQSGRPEVADWEKRLDRARRALEAVAPENRDCIGAVNDGNADAVKVSQEVFARGLKDSPIPLETRLDAAERSGIAAAVSLVQELMTAPRDLRLTPQTAEADRIVGQPIVFKLVDLDPDWGTSVAVTVDWRDGTLPRQTNAERLRQGERLENVYRKIGTFNPVALASDGATTIGQSSAEVYVKPSPETRAERLADIFLTTQFALALLIASVVYYWRFHTEAMVFGSNGRHYVTAFAMGFAAYAAVTELPKALGELALKAGAG